MPEFDIFRILILKLYKMVFSQHDGTNECHGINNTYNNRHTRHTRNKMSNGSFLPLSLVLIVGGFFWTLLSFAVDDDWFHLQSGRICATLLERKIGADIADVIRPSPAFMAQHRTDNYQYGGIQSCPFPVKDQGALGSCWAVSGAHIIEQNMFVRDGQYVPLSIDYFMAMHIYRQALMIVHSEKNKIDIGGKIEDFSRLLNLYGAVPASRWHSKLPLNTNGRVINILVTQLNLTAGAFRKELDRLNTDVKSKKMARPAYKLAWQEFEERCQTSIKEIIEKFTGYLPDAVEYNNELLTPMEFADRYLRPKRYNEGGGVGDDFFKNGLEYSLLHYSSSQIFDAVARSLQNTHAPVAVAMDWDDTFVDSHSGIATIEGFFPREQLVGTNADHNFLSQFIARNSPRSQDLDLGHIVIVLDYSLDKNGKVDKFLVRNSWGSEQGDGGYFHVYRDYFLSKVIDAVIPDTRSW